MIRRFLKDMWLILHEAFQFNFVEEMAYHSTKTKTSAKHSERL